MDFLIAYWVESDPKICELEVQLTEVFSPFLVAEI